MRFKLKSLLLVVVSVAFVMSASLAYWNRWGGRVHYSRKIREHIQQLREKRPSSITPRQWECLVDWTENLHGNSMLPYNTSVSELADFESRMAERLSQPVDHTDIEWIWDEFATICDAGKRYQQQRISVNSRLKSLGSHVYLEPPDQAQPEKTNE